MEDFWRRSRITKALTDGAHVGSFEEAEARLNAVRVAVFLNAKQMNTRAGQAATLTALATAKKCFGRVTLVIEGDSALLSTLPLGTTLRHAAHALGAQIEQHLPEETTHCICIGEEYGICWTVHCWWDRWLAGTRAADSKGNGDSRVALAGVFSAALAIREVFACVVANRTLRPRDATVDLWEPWTSADPGLTGPSKFDVPDRLWFLGLGHLGQAFVWSLCLLGVSGGSAVAQDDQTIGAENEATSLLVLPDDLPAKKTRFAARWLESCGWHTDIIERRHHGDIAVREEDPPYLLCGLDRLQPRLTMAEHGFEYMIDAGLGHGANDFEGIQIRTIAKGQSINGLWDETALAHHGIPQAQLVENDAYAELESRIGSCGIVSFAEASTAVPFVGAATGALVITQAIRLASLQPSTLFLQLELGAPEMTTSAGTIGGPTINLGSISTSL